MILLFYFFIKHSKLFFITDITDKERQFCLTYELETNQLQITIYETLLDKSDDSHIQDDESYVPNLILSSDFSTGQYGVDFRIDPTIYNFRYNIILYICHFF